MQHASVTLCLHLGFKAEICIKEVKLTQQNPLLIEWPRETRRQTDICTFNYSIRVTVMNNHAGSTRPTGSMFSQIKLPRGE